MRSSGTIINFEIVGSKSQLKVNCLDGLRTLVSALANVAFSTSQS